MSTPAMTVRERFQATMAFQPVDRMPMIEWAAWWDKTVERWQGEGLPVSDRYDLYRHFGLDLYYQDWLGAATPDLPAPAHHGAPIVRTLDEYRRIRPFLYPMPDSGRLDAWRGHAAAQRRGEGVFWLTLEGYFWFPRQLLGIEEHLYAFYDQPELLHQINQDLAAWHRRVLEQLTAVCRPDFIAFAEDLSYNHGPMLSQALFDEFLLPYYRRVVPLLKEHGIISIVDSDGQIEEPAPWFLNAGLEGILPLERQAGVDLVRLRERHPQLKFIGAFDKMTMTRGTAAMRAEFERLLPVARQGGFIISVDHQTPPGVSLAQYHDYLRLLAEYAGRVGR